MRHLRLLLVMSLATMCLAFTASPALAGTYQFSGKNADAYLDDWHEDGSYTSMWIWSGTGSGVSKQPGGRATHPADEGAYFGYYSLDLNDASTAADDVRTEVWADYPGASAGIDRKLTTASLLASVPATISVWTGPSASGWGWSEPDQEIATSVSIDLDWAGYGPLWTEGGTWRSHTEGFVSVDRYSSKRRAAEVNGTITFGTQTLSGPFGGGLYDTRNGSISIGDWPTP